MNKRLLATVLVAAVGLVACGDKPVEQPAPPSAPEASDNPAAVPSPAAPQPVAPPPAEPAPDASEAPLPPPQELPIESASSDSDAIGVAECDDFLAKYEACLADKVPAESRAMFEQSLQSTRDGWKQALATPGGRDGLKAACEQAAASSGAALQAYGCTF